MSKPYRLINGYVPPRIEDLRKLRAMGWIHDIDDWRADLECYGLHDDVNLHCEDCPLEDPCSMIRQYSEDHY